MGKEYQQDIEQFKNILKPLYSKLISDVKDFGKSKCFFCMQWGKNYPFDKNTGILFVGRAVNGWVTDSEDIVKLFDSEERIFAREDQMQWVENLAGNEYGYNTNKSAFWRVVKGVAVKYYDTNWSTHIAWSNLCKASPFDGGNPSDGMFYAQLETCHKILKAEIDFLHPKVVILLTGEDWANSYLCFLNGGSTKSKVELPWNDSTIKIYEIEKTKYILSLHPQGKPEDSHVESICKLLAS